MKKTSNNIETDYLQPEYEFDYSKAKRNKYASVFKNQDCLVRIEPDIFQFFNSEEKVNNALRSLLDLSQSSQAQNIRI